jgi:hypothetical protein
VLQRITGRSLWSNLVAKVVKIPVNVIDEIFWDIERDLSLSIKDLMREKWGLLPCADYGEYETRIGRYMVHDEQKFMMFMLRYGQVTIE